MRIYARDQVCGFRFTRQAWGELSNFQPLAVPIAAGPWTFATSEHAYLPAMHSDAMGTIAVLLDTSGSIYSYLDTLASFWTEVREVAHELNPERVIVLQVDTRITDVAEYAGEDLPEQLEAKGGGGTDFRPGFAWLDAEGIEPACCLYFTDMECSSYPETEPPFDVLFCNYGPPPSQWNREPWGERIDIAA